MPTRNVNLTEHFDQFIEAGVASGRFSNASEIVREGLRLLEHREEEDRARRPELMNSAARTYHLSFSRSRVSGPAVKHPRHFILFRVVPPALEIARILHDGRDLSQHLPEPYRKPDEG